MNENTNENQDEHKEENMYPFNYSREEFIRRIEEEDKRFELERPHIELTPEELESDFPPMSEDIFTELPPLLHAACDRLADDEERETFLVGAIGVLSGMLPNVKGRYMSREVSPNLYVFVMGKYGTGKGALLWAKDMGEATDAHRVQQSRLAGDKFTEEEAQYHRQMRLYDKGKLQEPPQAPRPPKHMKLYLPANSTKTALMQLLMENNGRGIIFETEGDTLADMLKQDYGNFSDVLRKAFHHEPVSYFRRANNEDVKISAPALSVVLSGTEDQLRRLIPSIENGLFSRFLFYSLRGNAEFKNPFGTEGGDTAYYFARLGERLKDMYQRLDARDTPLWFAMQPQQEQDFVQQYSELKQEIHQHISHDLQGTINRLAIINFRIAMILTAIRYIDAQDGTLTCTETDYRNAIAITRHLLQYSLHVYETLQTRHGHNQLAPIANKQAQISECCRQFKLGRSFRVIAESVLGDKNKFSTIYNWTKRYCDKMRA
ncbi:MAG: DUF3987 domain-containing protein [Chitinophagales bacterium]|nr:DUF3987 domain-containing protein [Chitinophagaceae bacterium]MCB9064996.1 DUF3987 domain-containing protein [Chitinophagales bacterium]